MRALARQSDTIDYAEAYRRTGSHVKARQLVSSQGREQQENLIRIAEADAEARLRKGRYKEEARRQLTDGPYPAS